MQGLKLPGHKTKIVCTIGPASRSESVLSELMNLGMNVARLNFAHSTLESHREDIRRIRSMAERSNRSCMILADLPGPKIRIGKLQNEPIALKKGKTIVLTTKEMYGTASRISVNYERLPESVSQGSIIYINDGFIQLRVEDASDSEVTCRVIIGGALLSGKGLNLPGAKLFVDAVTERDLELVDFGLKEGVDAFSISFVEKADDIYRVKEFAKGKGINIFIVAKIERAEAIENIDEIIGVADAIMIARGDLGVQIPIEDVPSVQKKIIRKANLLGRPVITATQMLVSMTENIRPTRAEVSDIANAILDGSDAVMLSEETAIGKYPVEAIKMMSKIAASIERQRKDINALSDITGYFRKKENIKNIPPEDIISLNAVETADALNAHYIVAPTLDGNIPRRISRFKPNRWILAFTDNDKTRNILSLSYGVFPVLVEHINEDSDAIREFILNYGISEKGDKIVLTGRAVHGRTDEIESIRIMSL